MGYGSTRRRENSKELTDVFEGGESTDTEEKPDTVRRVLSQFLFSAIND